MERARVSQVIQSDGRTQEFRVRILQGTGQEDLKFVRGKREVCAIRRFW